MGISLRQVDPQVDSAGLTELMCDHGFRGWTAEGMRRHLMNASLRPRLTSVAVHEAAGERSPGGSSIDATDARHAPHCPGVVGCVDVYRNDNMMPGSFQLSLLVDPAARRRGTGRLLYEAAMGFASEHGVRELRTPAWDDDPDSLAFAARRGFEPEHLVLTSRLDAAAFDETRFAPALERVRAQGIRLVALAEVPDTPANRRRLYELYRETWLDAPDGPPLVDRMPPPDDFTAPLFRPDAARGLLLAVEGDEWVGFTHMLSYSKTWARNAMTGVRRSHRGRGVALALKVLAIQQARARGVTEITTGNDARNAPMLAVNRRLGFVTGRGQYSLLKRFTSAAG